MLEMLVFHQQKALVYLLASFELSQADTSSTKCPQAPSPCVDAPFPFIQQELAEGWIARGVGAAHLQSLPKSRAEARLEELAVR